MHDFSVRGGQRTDGMMKSGAGRHVTFCPAIERCKRSGTPLPAISPRWCIDGLEQRGEMDEGWGIWRHRYADTRATIDTFFFGGSRWKISVCLDRSTFGISNPLDRRLCRALPRAVRPIIIPTTRSRPQH